MKNAITRIPSGAVVDPDCVKTPHGPRTKARDGPSKRRSGTRLQLDLLNTFDNGFAEPARNLWGVLSDKIVPKLPNDAGSGAMQYLGVH